MNTMLLSIDYSVFTFLNNFAGRSQITDTIFRFLADGIIFFMIGGLALFVLQKRQRMRYRACIEALVAAFIARAIFASILHAIFDRVRPFVKFSVHQLISISPSQLSFPSGHACMMFAIAFSIFLRNRRWGTVYLILAGVSSIARVIAGVHFPSDILAGILVGIMSSLIVWLVTLVEPRRTQE